MKLAAAALALLAGAGMAAAKDEGAPPAGERAYQKCYACHSLTPGENDLSGPSLHNVIGRKIAAEPGFDYSPALIAFAERHPRWTEDLIARYVADPEALVPGTDMTFTGMRDPEERAALIAYLKDRPQP